MTAPTQREALIAEARKHVVELQQCSIFARDVGPAIAKSMTDAADFLLRLADALSQSPSLPAEGWKMVPVEATEEMKRRGFDAFLAAHDRMFSANEPCGPIWKVMLAAAPSAPLPPEDGR